MGCFSLRGFWNSAQGHVFYNVRKESPMRQSCFRGVQEFHSRERQLRFVFK